MKRTPIQFKKYGVKDGSGLKEIRRRAYLNRKVLQYMQRVKSDSVSVQSKIRKLRGKMLEKNDMEYYTELKSIEETLIKIMRGAE